MFNISTFKYYIVLTIFIFVSSCSGVATSTSNPTATQEIVDIPTSTATSTLVPTIEATATSQPLPPVKTQCAGIPKETQKLDLSGVVALDKPAKIDGSEFGFFLLNLKNGNTIRDVYEGLSTQVSPDRKYLAYDYFKGDTVFLSVLDSTGKIITDFEFRPDGRIVDYFNWQNPEQLRILYEGMGDTLSAKLLNPFTKEHAPLRTDWTGAYAPKNPFEDKLVQWEFDQHATSASYVYGANILYDSSLTRVLYPKDNSVVSLVDVKTEKELASAQFTDWGKLPSWSPNGKHLMIVNHEGNVDEFYLIARDGKEFQRITNFLQELDSAFVPEYSWSPDSKQIAFWLNIESGEQESGAQAELAILDVGTRQVTRLCIQGISVLVAKPWIMAHPTPIWSPNSKYIMFTQWDDPTSRRNYHILIMDPITGVTRRFSKNTAPIGWMSSEQ